MPIKVGKYWLYPENLKKCLLLYELKGKGVKAWQKQRKQKKKV